jgi:hypothetical protein
MTRYSPLQRFVMALALYAHLQQHQSHICLLLTNAHQAMRLWQLYGQERRAECQFPAASGFGFVARRDLRQSTMLA